MGVFAPRNRTSRRRRKFSLFFFFLKKRPKKKPKMPVIAQLSRDVMQDFEETRDLCLQKDDAFQSILRVQKKGMDYGQSQQTYETWNGDDYDSQMLAVGYKAPLWAVDYLLHLKL